jgi:HlyD family secretion protein
MVVATGDNACLFVIGDIDNLQVWASVNETDIASVHPQQAVRIKVDCFPDKVFEGTVKQIRLNAKMLKNKVTYTVVIAIAKGPTVLLPYMTATAEFQ